MYPPNNGGKGWHCDECGITWPFYSNYEKCKLCSGPTDRTTSLTAMTIPQAEQLIKEHADEAKANAERQALHAKFDEWYAERATAEIEAEMAKFFEAWVGADPVC